MSSPYRNAEPAETSWFFTTLGLGLTIALLSFTAGYYTAHEGKPAAPAAPGTCTDKITYIDTSNYYHYVAECPHKDHILFYDPQPDRKTLMFRCACNAESGKLKDKVSP